jgi:type IV pilus assembly protein PilN
MARINLLPWRAERRRQRERDFRALLVGAVVAAVLACLVWGYWMDLRIDDQEARNAYLGDEIRQLDGKLEEIRDLETTKARLLARQRVIEQLQASRAQMVHLFDEVVSTMTDGVRLTSMKQSGDQIALQGIAQANGDVANYMRNLDASGWMQRSDLQKTEIRGNDKRNRYEFVLTVRLRSTDRPGQETAPGDAAPATPQAPPTGKPAATPMPTGKAT